MNACPHCGKVPSLDDLQSGVCPATGEPITAADAQKIMGGDLHGPTPTPAAKP